MKSQTQRSRTGESNLSVMLAVGRMFGHSAGYPAYDGPERSKATQNRAKREDRMSVGRDPLLRGRTQKWLAPDPGCRGTRITTEGPLSTGATFGAAFQFWNRRFRSRQCEDRVGACRPLAGDGCAPHRIVGCFEARTLGGPNVLGYVTI